VNTTINWSAPAGGSVSPASGDSTTFTAPGTTGSYYVRATAAANGVTNDSYTTVIAAPTASLAASTTNPLYGATNVTITPTGGGSVYGIYLGTTQGGVQISTNATNNAAVGVQTGGFTTAQTYWTRVFNAASTVADASVTITPQTVSVSTPTPSNTNRTCGEVVAFSASASGGVSSAVTWSCSGGSFAGANWTAPTFGSGQATYTITATSVTDPTKSASTSVYVYAVPTSSISASTTSPLYGATNVTVTPTGGGDPYLIYVGTNQGGSQVSSTATSGTPIGVQTGGFTAATTYWARTYNHAFAAADSSVTITPQTVSVAVSPTSASRSVSVNLMCDGSFDNGMTYYSIYDNGGGATSSYQATGGVDGGPFVRFTHNTTINTFGLSAADGNAFWIGAYALSTWYTLSFYARGRLSATGAGFFDAWNQAPENIVWLENPPLSATVWQRYSVKWMCTTAKVLQWFMSVNNCYSGLNLELDFDHVQLQVNTSATQFLKCDILITPTVSGAANTSVSFSQSAGTYRSDGYFYYGGLTAGAKTATATCVADGTKSATSTITLVALPTGSLTMSTNNPLYGATDVTVTPTFTAGATATVGVLNGTGSEISSNATSGVALPVQPTGFVNQGTYILIVTNSVGATYLASSVTTNPQWPSVSIPSPAAANVNVSQTQAYSATVTGAVNTNINWSATGGSFSPTSTASGATTTWTAPATPGSYTITATSAADGSTTNSTTVNVYALPGISLAASTTSPLYGATNVTVTPTGSGGTTSITVGTSVGGTQISASATSGVALAVQAGGFTAATTYYARGTNVPGTTADASVTITPQTVSVAAITGGGGYQTVSTSRNVSTTVSGAVNTNINWTATGGTFSPISTASGVATSWTAPASIGTYTLTATAAANGTSTNTTTVTTVANPTGSIAASTTSPLYGATTTTVTPTWTGSSAIVGTTLGGSDISAAATSGTPITVQASGFTVAKTYYLRVSNLAGTTADYSVTVTPQTVAVGVPSPATANVNVSQTQIYLANVTGAANTAVTWSATGGSFTGATWNIPATPGTYTITATSVADPTKTNSTTAIVYALPTLTMVASTMSPLYGATNVTLTMTYTGTLTGNKSIGTTVGGSEITASAVSGTPYAVQASGFVTQTIYYGKITSITGYTMSGNLTITPQTVVVGAISLQNFTVSVSHNKTFSSTISGAVNTSINWTATGGTFSPISTATGVNTVYTAPATPGSYTITATSAADGSKTATTTATVVAMPTISAFSATPNPVFSGTTAVVTTTFSGGTGSVNNGIGAVTTGFTTPALSSNTTYTLTVTNAAGDTVTQDLTITVNATSSGKKSATASSD
jgi:hypothetical protein